MLREKLIECNSKARLLENKIHENVLSANSLKAEINKANDRLMPRHIAASLDKDARNAAAKAAGRVAETRAQLVNAEKLGTAGEEKVKLLEAKLRLDLKEEKGAQLRAAAAAQAGSPKSRGRLKDRLVRDSKRLGTMISDITGE